MTIVKDGRLVVRRGLSISDLLDADEVFITNSNMGIMPVCRIERKPIGDDQPGKVTLKLMEGYADAVASADM